MGFFDWYDANVKGYYLKDVYGMQWFAAAIIAMMALGAVGIVLSLVARKRGKPLLPAFAVVVAAFILGVGIIGATNGVPVETLLVYLGIVAAFTVALGGLAAVYGLTGLSAGWMASISACIGTAFLLLIAYNQEPLRAIFSNWYYAIVAALLIMMVAALFMGGRQKWGGRALAYAALCLAIAFVLSSIRLYRMPSGGSVVLCAILPLVAFAVYRGVWQAAVVCVAYGLLQMVQGAWIIHPMQGALDYLVAYSMLAIGGVVRYLPIPKKYKLPAALIISGVLRWGVHVLSGVVFFSADAIEAGQAPFVYSALYNTFLFPEVILSVLISLLPGFSRLFAPLENVAEIK